MAFQHLAVISSIIHGFEMIEIEVSHLLWLCCVLCVLFVFDCLACSSFCVGTTQFLVNMSLEHTFN